MSYGFIETNLCDARRESPYSAGRDKLALLLFCAWVVWWLAGGA